ncbi:hypothetical protein FXO38_32398, partial [Capsicum annuum]
MVSGGSSDRPRPNKNSKSIAKKKSRTPINPDDIPGLRLRDNSDSDAQTFTPLVNEPWVIPGVASASGSASPPPPIEDDTNAHLIGLILGDKDRIGGIPHQKKLIRHWSEIPEDHRQVMFEEFKRNAGAKLRNWLERVRRTGNVAQWLLKIVYDDLCIYWESPEYKAISKQNKKARASLKDGSLHIGGAKSVRVIVREMEDLGREPTRLEAEAIDGVQLAAMSQQITNLSRAFAQSVAQNEVMSKTVEEFKKKMVSMNRRRHRSPSP